MLKRLKAINDVMHNLLKLYPEQFIVYATFGTFSLGMAGYILATRPIITYRPYYRGMFFVLFN
jgi:hypothetical protein